MGDAGALLRKGLISLLVLGLVAMGLTGCSTGGSALKQDGAGGLAKLEKVDVRDSDEFTTVVLVLDRPVTFTSVRVNEPPKVVVDLAGVDVGKLSGMLKVDKGPVSYITPSNVENAKRIARLEIGLTQPSSSRIAQNGGTINIIFSKKKDVAAGEKKPVSAPASPPAEELKADKAEAHKTIAAAEVKAEPAPAPAQKTASPVPAVVPAEKAEAALKEAATVKGLTYVKTGGAYHVTVKGDGKFSNPKVFMVGTDRLVIDLPGVGSYKDKDAIELGGGCVKGIRLAEHKGADGKVRVVLDLKGEVDYAVKGKGEGLVVTVAPKGTDLAKLDAQDKSVDRKDAPAAQAPVVKAPAAKAPAQLASNTEPSSAAARKIDVTPTPTAKAGGINIYVSKKDGSAVLSSAPIDEEVSSSKDDSRDYVKTESKIYTGGRISFDIQDADLDKVVKLLADVAGLNLIMDPSDVKGKVTLKLDKVPWDQAMDILLRLYKLDMIVQGNVLRVAPRAKLDEEKRMDLQQLAEQKKLEEQAQDLFTKTIKVNYSQASTLEQQVKANLSSRGTVMSNLNTNELIVRDVKAKIDEVAELVGRLDKEVNQIMIEARIITVDTGYSRTLGVSWGLQGANTSKKGNVGFAYTNGPNAGQKFTTGDPSYQLTVPAELALGGASSGIGTLLLGNVIKDMNLDLTIQALETVNKAQTLSAPKIITLENQSASITQGTTLYVQTTSAAGTKPEPLNANLSLTVTPRVTGNNYIMLNVTATDNKPSTPPPGSTAAIDTKSVTTNVIVKDGDTIVLGGIYTRDSNHSESRVPLLGRIPIIGWLFKTQTYDEPQKELLIFITPKLIKQTSTRV